MGISIQNSVGMLKTLNTSSSAIQSSMKKISTGLKINSAADDASGYQVLTRMNVSAGTLAQSSQNTQTSNALLKTADGAIGSTVSSLSSLHDQLLKAANGTNNDSDISALQEQVNQTVSQISDNAGVTFNDKSILDGSAKITVAGDNGYNNVSLPNMSAQALGLQDSKGNSTLDLSTSKGISNALDVVDTALQSSLSQQTKIGATQESLDFSASNYTTQAASVADASSTTGDSDMAQQITNLKSSQTQQNIALHMMAISNHRNSDVLALLG